MAAEDAADGEVEAFDGAVFAKGLESVLGAGRREATAGGKAGRDVPLVEANQGQKHPFHGCASPALGAS